MLQRQNVNMKEEAEEMLLMTFVALRQEKGRKGIENIQSDDIQKKESTGFLNRGIVEKEGDTMFQ